MILNNCQPGRLIYDERGYYREISPSIFIHNIDELVENNTKHLNNINNKSQCPVPLTRAILDLHRYITAFWNPRIPEFKINSIRYKVTPLLSNRTLTVLQPGRRSGKWNSIPKSVACPQSLEVCHLKLTNTNFMATFLKLKQTANI